MKKDRRNRRALYVVTALGLSLTGCSYVPDALNPVEWYQSSAEAVGGWLGNDEVAGAGDTETWPNVSSVPGTPVRQTSGEGRTQLRDQLVADRANARYDDEPARPVIPDAASAVASATAPGSASRGAVPVAPPPGGLAETAPAPPAPAPTALTTTGETLKPVRLRARDETTRQGEPESGQATLPSAVRSRIAGTAPRSSLWPNSPPPVSEGDRAVTSARVGEPAARRAPASGNDTRSLTAGGSNREVTVTRRSAEARPRASVTAPEPASIPPQTAPAPAPSAPALAAPAAPPPAAPTGGFALTAPASGPAPFGSDGAFVSDDPSVIIDESALPDAFPGFAPADPVSGGLAPAGLASAGPASGGLTPAGLAPAGPATGLQGGSWQAGVIRFANGSARLSAADQGVIRELVPLIREYNAVVEIVGHSSSRTRNMEPARHKLVNFEMSLKRANAVAEALVAAGAPSDRVSVQAVGDSQPRSSEAMPAGEAENRRAEIYLVY